MKEKIKKCKKIDTNFVGATLGRPTFEEYTQTAPKIRSNLNFKFQTLTSNAKGITLIALIITIIVMVILVGVTVSVAINGGLFTNAKQAKTDTQNAIDSENELSEGKVNIEGTLYNSMNEYLGTPVQGGSVTEVKVTVDGQPVTLTPENVGDYLGKVVTNYKKDYNTNITEKITIDGSEYTVSTKYRLYYVDFENKYQEGTGTIYLKAECTGNAESLQRTAPSDGDVVKIEELNPELYKDEVTPPNENNENMKAVIWLTNTDNWEELKSNLNGINASDINYIVGAPSVEMMIDSYNLHYKLTGETPNYTTAIPEGERRKLFYQYNTGYTGYKVGPGSGIDNEYATGSLENSVYMDPLIDSMYYPGDSQSYWLASPSASSSNEVMDIMSGLRRLYIPLSCNGPGTDRGCAL